MESEIKKLLKEEKYTLKKLSRRLGKKKSKVKKVLNKLKKVRFKKIAGQKYYYIKTVKKKKESDFGFVFDFFKEHYAVIILLTLTLGFIGFNLFRNETVWWDEAEYLVFAKNLATGSNLTGFWEGRAIFYPLLLGVLNFATTNEYFLRIINALFGVLCVLFTYYSFKKMFDKKIAFLASLLFASNWVFQFYAVRFLTDIPALMLMMISLYFFAMKGKKNKLLSGLFLGLSFITRFTTIFITPVYLFVNYVYRDDRKEYYWILGLLIGLAPSLFYDLVNGDVPFTGLYSFFIQNVINEASGESILAGDWTYYLTSINTYLNPFLTVCLIGGLLLLVYESFKEIEKWDFFVMLYFLICFVMFSFVSTLKELRFIMQLYPFLYLIIVLFFEKLIGYFKDERVKIGLYSLMGVLFFYSIINSATYLDSLMESKMELGVTVKTAGEYIQNVTSTDEIIIANYPPVSSYYTNRFVIHDFGSSKEELIQKMEENNVTYILLYTGDSFPDYFANIPYPFKIAVNVKKTGQPSTYIITKSS